MRSRTQMIEDWIVPDWPVSDRVRAVTTTRQGGISLAPYASMNPADHVGDQVAAVRHNRQQLQQALALPAQPVWLQQVHGSVVVNAAGAAGDAPCADAAWCSQAGVVCAVLTADCLPVLLADAAGRAVGVVHAGWRGLVAGVIEATVKAMGQPGEQLLAWLGPAIGPAAYQVGAEVRTAFMAQDPQAAVAFTAGPDGHWATDLYQLARQRLADCGVTAVYGGEYCSYTDATRFFSYRRDGTTGRMATLIWLQDSS